MDVSTELIKQDTRLDHLKVLAVLNEAFKDCKGGKT